jgi:hypothetical protein
MKLIGLIGLIMLVTVVLISWVGLVADFETNYVDTGISEASAVNSTFTKDYSGRAAEMNETFSPLKESIDDLGSDAGWLDTLVDGAVILPKLIITLPGMILATFKNAITDMITILNLIGIPSELTLIAIIMLSLVAVIKIIQIIRTDPSI